MVTLRLILLTLVDVFPLAPAITAYIQGLRVPHLPAHDVTVSSLSRVYGAGMIADPRQSKIRRVTFAGIVY